MVVEKDIKTLPWIRLVKMNMFKMMMKIIIRKKLLILMVAAKEIKRLPWIRPKFHY